MVRLGHYSQGKESHGECAKMIFFRVGWMKHYLGIDEDDPTLGPHGYLKDSGLGHECFTFVSRDGSCSEYVPISEIDVGKNFGVQKNTKFVDDVVCV